MPCSSELSPSLRTSSRSRRLLIPLAPTSNNSLKPSIIVDGLSKRYRRYGSKSLREALADIPRRLRPGRLPNENDRWLWAVHNLSFEAFPGESLGIIGANGAGKTTTLKLLTGITHPTSGTVQLEGRVSSLIELAAGFHPELTGKENTFLYGTILGLRRSEIADRYDEIVDFSGLQRFMDTPVKYFSSGMYARLGFSIAAHTAPEVMLVDEVLAVGDYSFQQRCYDRMYSLQQKGTTTVLVTHNLSAVTEFCSRVIVMDRGEAIYQGPSAEALGAYAKAIRRPVDSGQSASVGEDGIAQKQMTHTAKVVDVRLMDSSGDEVVVVSPGRAIRMAATIEFYEDAPSPVFAFFARSESGQLVYDQTTSYQGITTPSFRQGDRVDIVYDFRMDVVEGIYELGIDLAYADLTRYYDRIESAASVVVEGGDGGKGIADLHCQFRFPNESSDYRSTPVSYATAANAGSQPTLRGEADRGRS